MPRSEGGEDEDCSKEQRVMKTKKNCRVCGAEVDYFPVGQKTRTGRTKVKVMEVDAVPQTVAVPGEGFEHGAVVTGYPVHRCPKAGQKAAETMPKKRTRSSGRGLPKTAPAAPATAAGQ